MSDKDYFNSEVPSVEWLRDRARRRMPRFAFDYLDGGCFSEVNLDRNIRELREVQLQPYYLKPFAGASQKTVLFGREYAAPFGIAPVGLQGLMWPGACEILARAATEHEVPFCLSTVGTASIETIAEITKGNFWFQLYHPKEDELRNKLLDRAEAAGCQVLVLLADTPTLSYRPKEIRNGLSIPPQMSLRNIFQMMTHPTWSFSQLLTGAPEFKTMKPYLPEGLSMKHLGLFMSRTFSNRLTRERIEVIRKRWKGKLVIKGLVNAEDCALAVSLGVDGIIVSNHGGRQLDNGQSTIKPLAALASQFGERITIMMDSGVRSGTDIAAALASGAKFVLMGRTPMYGVGALGSKGGYHTLNMLKRQLQQVMEQIACEKICDFPKHLIKP